MKNSTHCLCKRMALANLTLWSSQRTFTKKISNSVGWRFRLCKSNKQLCSPNHLKHSIMRNELIEIASSQWEKLRDLYANKRIYSCSYNLLQTLIDCVKQHENFKVSIYALNGEWETDGTFIAKFYNQFYCNALSDNFQRLLEALNCLDNTQEYWVSGFQERCTLTVKQHFLSCGLLEEEFRPEGTFWYHLPINEALAFKVEPPSHLKLQRLQECHVDQVNSVWPHRAPGSTDFVKLLIQYNDSVGVFDEGNNLIAWCLILPLGSLGLLQVIDSRKRQGLGQLVVRYMSKLLATKGLEVTASVVFANLASRSMFEKLGFKIVDKVYWARKPAKKSLS